MDKFILSIDQGTTGTTAVLINSKTFSFVDKLNMEFSQIYPQPGWVEHDLNDIWSTVEKTVSQILINNKITPDQIDAIGITNQRETTCAYDKSGKPLANAIVWQDRRTANYCNDKSLSYSQFQMKTGLPLDPYFSGTKMNWLLTNNSNVKKAAKDKNLNLSTIDTFLLYKLTSSESFYTEASNASRTLLMDLDSGDWSKELLNFFEISQDHLPEIKDSFSCFGKTKNLSFLPDGIPIMCMLGDQQAALFGQAGYKAGDLKCTYGTGAFILLNTGDKKAISRNGLLTTVAYKHNGKLCYALEGSSYIAGAAVGWLRDNLNLIETSSDVENLAKKVQDLKQMEHVQFLPFFTGIGSPYWNSEAKAAIVGLTRDTGKPHIARACLEGMALSINDSIQALIADSPNEVSEIRVDGGASMNNLLLQIQANFSKLNIIRPKVIETTAYGVALGAAIGLKTFDFEQLSTVWKEDKKINFYTEKYFIEKQKLWNSTIKKIY